VIGTTLGPFAIERELGSDDIASTILPSALEREFGR
jgi:hypothetical protein